MNLKELRRAIEIAVGAGHDQDIKGFDFFTKEHNINTIDRSKLFPYFLMGPFNEAKKLKAVKCHKNYALTFIIYDLENQIDTKNGTDHEFMAKEWGRLEALGEAAIAKMIKDNIEIVDIIGDNEIIYDNKKGTDMLIAVQITFTLQVFHNNA